jgi:hypothetical protein
MLLDAVDIQMFVLQETAHSFAVHEVELLVTD